MKLALRTTRLKGVAHDDWKSKETEEYCNLRARSMQTCILFTDSSHNCQHYYYFSMNVFLEYGTNFQVGYVSCELSLRAKPTGAMLYNLVTVTGEL